MTKQNPYGRYAVYSYDKWQALFPNAVPAGRYDDLDGAKDHADSVTYKMVVVDMTAESRGFVYQLTPETSGASQLACNIVNNTFLSLDGFEAMRKQMRGTDYTAEHFGAELARITDREICEHTGMTRDELEALCGTDSADASDALLASPPVIQAIDRNVKDGSCTLVGFFSDNAERKLFSYYIDELSFADSELIGLTEKQAHQLRLQRDVEYLRS